MPPLPSLKLACTHCSLHNMCVPVGLDIEECAQLETIIDRARPLAKGHYIYMPGDPFNALYVIRTGAVKTYLTSAEGDEYITGFYLPGDIIGLEALSNQHYLCGAKTLETTSLCTLPYAQLERLASTIPSISRQLLKIMSGELYCDDQRMLISTQSAEIRLIALLLSLSNRFQRRGYSATEFHLSMSRAEIGSFLGLAVETISRLMKRMQENKLISFKNRTIKILDLDRLHAIINKNA